MVETGTILQNRYEILKPIGQGGMGAVYLAKDQRLGNIVALKETFFSDTFLLAAFEREARILAGLRHSALPKVIDHFADNNGQFLVMEYISGEDLHELLEDGRKPSIEEALHWADQLLDALDYLHSQQPPIIHRDIKPQNLKLTSRNQIVLLDFGLAKGTAHGMTQAGSKSSSSIFGYTPSYAPLEQAQGSGTDPQSDIYSLAATLYHLITGKKPVDAVSRATSIMNGEPDPLAYASDINRQISIALNDVIMRAMAIKRSERPASAAEMRKMLRDSVGTNSDDVTVKAQSKIAGAEMKKADGPAARPVLSTEVFASTPTTPAGESGDPASYATRASATNMRRPMPARAPEKSLYRPRLATAAQRQPATVAVVSGGAMNSSKVIAATVVLIVAVAFVVYAFKPSSKNENANATPTIIQKVEQAGGAEQQGSTAKPAAAEARDATGSRIESFAPIEQPVKEEQRREQDDDKSKADDREVKEAKQTEPAQEPQRANPEPQPEPAQGQPHPRPEEVRRDDPMRPMPPPPDMNRPPHPPPPHPRDMPPPPPPRRRP
ncbi:MAG TPA: protein kinase [Blastocatellia bacterium]|nr:protein kinase [Blastocatellia bacterium]